MLPTPTQLVISLGLVLRELSLEEHWDRDGSFDWSLRRNVFSQVVSYDFQASGPSPGFFSAPNATDVNFVSKQATRSLTPEKLSLSELHSTKRTGTRAKIHTVPQRLR